MLQITIPAVEQWDESKQEFVCSKAQTLQLEHSLVSLSKWESKWHKAFLTKDEKTFEETLNYIKCMTLTQNVDSETYNFLTNENFKLINQYIEDAFIAGLWHSSDPSITRDHYDAFVGSNNLFYND